MSEHWLTTPNGLTRARGLGLPFDGTPGPFNAITDVAGVEVGYTTLIAGDGPLVVGQGPVRTGVTAILPRGRHGGHIPCAAAPAVLNGNGEMTGLAWIAECGELETPVTITNTHSCGVARDATIRWIVERGVAMGQDFSLPVAGETYDGVLNDINGFHVKEHHVLAALDGAAGGPIAMGSVGGGTGMRCYGFKGGSASASRIAGPYTVGVFVQANFGARHELTVRGVPVGREIPLETPPERPQGSIIAIVATDAPLMAHQLARLARRVPMGLARTGTIGHNGSGDIFLAFSTANAEGLAPGIPSPRPMRMVPNTGLDWLFGAVVEATEEAVIDAMVANATMTGINGATTPALPHDRLVAIMRTHGRMA